MRAYSVESSGHFKANHFNFYCSGYNVVEKVKGYLSSLKKQQIYLKRLFNIIEFEQNEVIWTYLSKNVVQISDEKQNLN